MTITIIPESVQGSMPAPSASVSIQSGVPRLFQVNILSADWQTVGDGVHQLDIMLDRSLDDGATWEQLDGAVTQSGAVKGGGIPYFAASWDGQGGLIRIGHILTAVNGDARYTYSALNHLDGVIDHGGTDPQFAWGLSVTI